MSKGCYVIIAAGGTGSRTGLDIPKQFIEINGKPIIAYTIEKFENCKKISGIVIVTLKSYEEHCREIAERFRFKKILCIVAGGKERQFSVYKGLSEIPDDAEYVLIHDAVRPFVAEEEITNVINEIDCSGCAVLATHVKDTIKTVNGNYEITGTPDRNALYAAQTPQGFYYGLIAKAYDKAVRDKFIASDDSQLVENIGIRPKIVHGSCLNFKITTREDLFLAELVINNRDRI